MKTEKTTEKTNETLYMYDETARAGGALLCGVDEAGRGPLCGPVAVAAVILDSGNLPSGLNDSKKLPEAKREWLYQQIVEKCLCFRVEMVSPQEIDRMNILQATLWGMREAVCRLTVCPQLVLVDGNKAPGLPFPCRCVVKGDATSASIAAASILAKVTRDRYMKELHEEYPQYQLAQHKGYPTKLHYELLRQHGIQPFYRKSFLKNWGTP